jgi:hypothetical protein
MHRLVALILAVLLLALPAVATAQNAGDEQYSDPFGQTEEPSGSQGDQPSDTQEQPHETVPPAAPAAPAEEQAVAAQAADPPTLPRTGVPASLLAGAGALLLAAGATLRRLVL